MYTLKKISSTKYGVSISDFVLGFVSYENDKWHMYIGSHVTTRTNRKKAIEAGILNIIKINLNK